MKYAFQYATRNKIIEDTPPISLEEAVVLWEKYKKDFIYRHHEGECPEICIWEDIGDDPRNMSYGKTLFHIDDSTQITNGRFYKVTTTEVILPNTQ